MLPSLSVYHGLKEARETVKRELVSQALETERWERFRRSEGTWRQPADFLRADEQTRDLEGLITSARSSRHKKGSSFELPFLLVGMLLHLGFRADQLPHGAQSKKGDSERDQRCASIWNSTTLLSSIWYPEEGHVGNCSIVWPEP